MSFVLLGILNSQAAGAAEAYFLSVLGGAEFDSAYSVRINSENDVYIGGVTQSTGSGQNDFLIAKYDTAGAVQWQRVLGGAGNDFPEEISISSDNKIYIFGRTQSAGFNFPAFLIAKYDSSGTIQWQRSLSGSATDRNGSIAIDSQNNVYITGDTESEGSGQNDFLIAKYDSSGTIQWQRLLGGVFSEDSNGIAIDSGNNVYICGKTNSTGAGASDFFLAKYNSSGTIQWQRLLGGSSGDSGVAIAIDSQDNVYVGGSTESVGQGSNDFLIAKYNSSGTIQWQRLLGSQTFEEIATLAIDSQDNVYATGRTISNQAAGSDDFLIAKYNSSGTIQWQRLLGGVGSDRPESIFLDQSDDIYIAGGTTSTGLGSFSWLIAKLPNDGSLEGTYSLDGNNIIYQASTLTSATSSLTSATSSLTSATSSLTSATSSLTDASASLTVVTEQIG